MWYGSVQNRIAENQMFVDEIRIGTGMTEYSWSDRDAYEVVEVKDQKHVVVREYDHVHIGEPMSNNWELVSNPNNNCRYLEKRGKYWYWTTTITIEDIRDLSPEEELRLALAGFDIEKIQKNGKQTKRRRANVSFGIAEYYYDYSF